MTMRRRGKRPGGEHKIRQRLSRLTPALLRSAAMLSCSAWIDLDAIMLAADSQGRGRQDFGLADEPPPGHPERLAADCPLTQAERESWARLTGQ